MIFVPNTKNTTAICVGDFSGSVLFIIIPLWGLYSTILPFTFRHFKADSTGDLYLTKLHNFNL